MAPVNCLNMRRTGGILGFGNKNLDLYSERLSALNGKRAASLITEIPGVTCRKGNPAAVRCTDKYPQNYEQLGLIAKLFPASPRHPLQERSARHMPVRLHACKLQTLMPTIATSTRWANTMWPTSGLWRTGCRSCPCKRWRWITRIWWRIRILHTRRIIDFLKLDWNDACLRFFENQRPVITPSKWQVRQPMYTSSIGEVAPLREPPRAFDSCLATCPGRNMSALLSP